MSTPPSAVSSLIRTSVSGPGELPIRADQLDPSQSQVSESGDPYGEKPPYMTVTPEVESKAIPASERAGGYPVEMWLAAAADGA
jgi:hypothetical protein